MRCSRLAVMLGAAAAAGMPRAPASRCAAWPGPMLRFDSLMCRGGFDLRRLCVLGTRRPTAHTCWQRHLAQQPLLLLEDGTLVEAQLQLDVQVRRCGVGGVMSVWGGVLSGFVQTALCVASSQVKDSSLVIPRLYNTATNDSLVWLDQGTFPGVA